MEGREDASVCSAERATQLVLLPNPSGLDQIPIPGTPEMPPFQKTSQLLASRFPSMGGLLPT